MEKSENKNINLNLSDDLCEKLVLSYVKKPILNILVGDFANDTNDLSKIFDIKAPNKGDIQLLHVRLDESIDSLLYHYDPGEYSITFNDENSLRNDFNVISPELINQICIYAKQHRYEDKGKLSVNIVLCASDKLYKFADMFFTEMELLLNKAFINGIDVSLFNIYEENFNVNLNQSKENLDFISNIYDMVNNHSKIVNDVYFLSNYDNNEIYTNTYITNLLYQISLYIRIRDVDNRILNKNYKSFSENEFLYVSDNLKNIHNSNVSQYCCALGFFQLKKPDVFIKKIIEFSVLNQLNKQSSFNINQILCNLRLNPILLSAEINELLISMLKKKEKPNVSKSTQYYNTWMDKLKDKHNLSLIQDNLVNESNVFLSNYIENKFLKTRDLLYSVIKETSISIYNLKELLNDIIKQFTKELKKCYAEGSKLKDELKMLEESKIPVKLPEFIINLYANSNFVNFIEFTLLKRWEKAYLKLLKNNLIIQFYEKFIECLQELFDLSLYSQKKIENYKQIIKYEIMQTSSKLDLLQLKNIMEYYSSLIVSLFEKDYYNLNENLFCNKLFDKASFEEATLNATKRVETVATQIYDEYVHGDNYFEEFCNRVGTDKKDAYSIFLDELYSNNPVTLRVIENEKLYKQICICVPYDFEVDNELIEVVKSSKNFANITMIRTFEEKNINVLYVNGNIDMNDVFHF